MLAGDKRSFPYRAARHHSIWLNYVEKNEKPSRSLHIRDDSEQAA